MNIGIIVCVKHVPDPEGISSSFVINHETNSVEPSRIATVLNPFDENALEAALKIKDLHPDEVKVTVLTLGYNISNNLIIKSLAPGADEFVQIDDEVFASGGMDSYKTVHALASAIRKIGKYDLILLGRQAADLNAGQAAVGLGHVLDLPTVTLAKSIEVYEDTVLIERSLVNRRVKVKCSLPAVVMVNSDNGQIRYPTFPQILASKKKPITIWNARDIGYDTNNTRNRLELRNLFKPEMPCRSCVMIREESPEEAGHKLAELLRQDHIL